VFNLTGPAALAAKLLPWVAGAALTVGLGWVLGSDRSRAASQRQTLEAIFTFARITHHASIERMTREAGLYAELEAERTRAVELAQLAERAFVATDASRAAAQTRLAELRGQINQTDRRLRDALNALAAAQTEWGRGAVPDCIVRVLRDGGDPATVPACSDATADGGAPDGVGGGAAAPADAPAVP
jgi:multidrug efflux pump subunit AcrA (membrane-fusion protein)